MKTILVACLLVCASGVPTVTAAERAGILIIAGKDSHGWGAHEFHAGAELLAKALNDSGLPVHAEVVKDQWPHDSSVFAGVKSVVIYCDGQDKHVLNGHTDDMAKLAARGVGLVCLHYALEVNPGDMQKRFMDWLGGYFDPAWSVNPVWTPNGMKVAHHPVTRGVKPIEIEDEWYYHIRFRPGMKGVTPLLSVVPPIDTLADEDGPRRGNPALREELRNGQVQYLAWVVQNDNGMRGFGFTGGHFHFNWTNDDFRKLVLNGIVWTAGLDVPQSGVPSKKPLIVRNQSILRAIAIGDVEDVERHIALGENINQLASSGMAPLHYAAARNQIDVGAVLIKHGADVNILSRTGNAPLHMCAERNYPGFAKLLIDNGADLEVNDRSGWAPLHVAAAKDRLDVARVLIKAGADVNKRSNLGGTALHEAAASGSAQMVKLLLDSGADKSIVAKTGKTALDIAIEFNNTAAIDLLKN